MIGKIKSTHFRDTAAAGNCVWNECFFHGNNAVLPAYLGSILHHELDLHLRLAQGQQLIHEPITVGQVALGQVGVDLGQITGRIGLPGRQRVSLALQLAASGQQRAGEIGDAV